jgi:hypothetical protein
MKREECEVERIFHPNFSSRILSSHGVNFQTQDSKGTQYIVGALGRLKLANSCQDPHLPKSCDMEDKSKPQIEIADFHESENNVLTPCSIVIFPTQTNIKSANQDLPQSVHSFLKINSLCHSH